MLRSLGTHDACEFGSASIRAALFHVKLVALGRLWSVLDAVLVVSTYRSFSGSRSASRAPVAAFAAMFHVKHSAGIGAHASTTPRVVQCLVRGFELLYPFH